MLSLITKTKLEQMAYEAMFATMICLIIGLCPRSRPLSIVQPVRLAGG
jgi:hypothetical protein